MIIGIYAIRDRYTGFLRPDYYNTDEESIRAFGDAVHAVRDGAVKTVMQLHPDDFALYRLGTMDTVSGVIHPERNPEYLVDGVGIRDEAKHDDLDSDSHSADGGAIFV